MDVASGPGADEDGFLLVWLESEKYCMAFHQDTLGDIRNSLKGIDWHRYIE